MRHAVEHGLHDLGHAGEDEDVLDANAGRARNRVLDQAGVLGRVGHREPRLVDLEAAARVRRQQDLDGLRVADKFLAERLGDRRGGDVVVGRADAARREDVVEGGTARIDGRDDGVLIVGNDAHLFQPDAELVQTAAEKGQIGVLRAARENLVADDDQRGGDGA